jgi:hypothetical protein
MWRTAAAVVAFITLELSTADAGWDDSHGYQGVRAYAHGPPYRTGYFSGVTVRVKDTRYRHHIRRHSNRYPVSRN